MTDRTKDCWNTEGARNLEGFFKGLADTSRLRILNLLFYGELCGCDIQHVLGASQSNVSRHLTYLKRSGLVLDRRSGYRVYYRLIANSSSDQKLLFEYLQRSFKRHGLFADDLKTLRDTIKEGDCSLSDRQAGLVGYARHLRPDHIHRRWGRRGQPSV